MNVPTANSIIGSVDGRIVQIGEQIEQSFPDSCQMLRQTLLNFHSVMPIFDTTLASAKLATNNKGVKLLIDQMIEHEAGIHTTDGKSHSTLFYEIVAELKQRYPDGIANPLIEKQGLQLIESIQDDSRKCLIGIYAFLKLYDGYLQGILGSCATSVRTSLEQHPYFRTHSAAPEEAKKIVHALQVECTEKSSDFTGGDAILVVNKVGELLNTVFGTELAAAAHR